MYKVTIAITLICAFFVIYPYLIYPLLLKLLKSSPVDRNPDFQCPVTLVFCAYNEARSMPEKLDNLEKLKQRHPQIQFLAFDDGSSDQTRELIEARGDLITLVKGGGRNGKAHGMKLLAQKATGDIIVFTDANVTLREDAIDNLMAYYADQTVGGVCGSLHYLDAEGSATAEVGSLYWKLEEYLKKEESRTGNVMGADGSIFSLRRKLYPQFPDTVLDDLTVSMAAVFNNTRLIKAEDVIAYEGLVAQRGEELARKIRISARAFHTHLFLRPNLKKMSFIDKFKYGSRKIVRWFGALFLVVGTLAAMVSAFLISPISGLILSLLIAGAVALGMTINRGPIAQIAEIIIALVATQIGVFRAMRGQTFAVWNPAKSR